MTTRKKPQMIVDGKRYTILSWTHEMYEKITVAPNKPIKIEIYPIPTAEHPEQVMFRTICRTHDPYTDEPIGVVDSYGTAVPKP